MALTQLNTPFPVFNDLDGTPLDGGFVYIGVAFDNPETAPISVYYDRELTQVAAQPLRTMNGYVVRNFAPAALYSDGPFSMTVRDRNNALVFYSPRTFLPDGFVLSDRNPKDVVALLANTSLTYTAGQAGTVTAGDIIRTLAEGFAYEVAAAGATDQHVTTAGGVKLYVLTDSQGWVNVDAFGAEGDGTTDDTSAIQTAVDNFTLIRFSAKTYGVGAPVQIANGNVTLEGAGGNEGVSATGTILQKLGTTAGSGSNTSPSAGAVTDSYAQNAILIIEHPDGLFNYGGKIKGLRLNGRATYDTDFGIYAPRLSQWIFEDVLIFRCERGFQTNDAWLCNFTRVTVNCDTVRAALASERGGSAQGFAATTYAFVWLVDAGGGGSGTSLQMVGCWARFSDFGYYIDGLAYSTLMACAADTISQKAYFLQTANNIHLNSCGIEDAICAPGIEVAGGRVTVTNMRADTAIYGSSGKATYRATGGATVTFVGCQFGDYDSVNSAANREIDGGSVVTEINTQVPTNGSGSVSFTSGSTLSVQSGNDFTFFDASESSRIKKMASATRSNQLLLQDVAILSAGTGVIEVTASGAGDRNMAGGKIKMFYSDNSFANGVGFVEAAFCVYREGANYYQDIGLGGIDVIAGNSFTTTPTFSIARSGNVWTITITPAHGDMTANILEVDWFEALEGDVTVEVP